MNKNTKKFVIIILIIVACIGGIKLVDTVKYHMTEKMAVSYLCEKYNAEASEFKLLDYKKAHYYWDDYYIFFDTLEKTDYSFEYKYKDRQFIVNRENGNFYDDYQLEDIEKWCTDWLKENVDERIIGIQINSFNIIAYQKRTNKSQYYILTEKDVKNFILYSYYNNYNIYICCNNANISSLEYENVEAELLNTVYKKIKHTKKIKVYFTDNVNMVKNTKKSTYDNKWWNEYTANINE